jgi:hypothetical protein
MWLTCPVLRTWLGLVHVKSHAGPQVDRAKDWASCMSEQVETGGQVVERGKKAGERLGGDRQIVG